MIASHTLGFPRIGEARELKFGLERYWRGEIKKSELEQIGKSLRARNWALQRQAGLSWVTVGDFAYYDHVAQHIQWLGCEPGRFRRAHSSLWCREEEIDRHFLLARGATSRADALTGDRCQHANGGETLALEMTKWFDTNYHYLVPEFDADTQFALAADSLFAQIAEAQTLGHPAKVALIGPLTFLWLGKAKSAHFDCLALIDKLVPVYGALLAEIAARNIEWVQIDEPILGLDLPEAWRQAFESVYTRLAACGVKLLLATYFSPLQENLRLACQLPTAGLHLDAIRAPQELSLACDWLATHKILSVGIVDGRNVWRSDLDNALASLEKIVGQRHHQLWLAPSCSLLHLPYSVKQETRLATELQDSLAFGQEKLEELALLQASLCGEHDADAFLAARDAFAKRKTSKAVHDPLVWRRIANLAPDIDRRHAAYAERRGAQGARIALPLFPTTTIGSFPQTSASREARGAWRRAELTDAEYKTKIRAEIAHAIAQQERLGLDVLVHGEAERNDMVEYFATQLQGFVFTEQGWVQSYGSRCVKPPIIYGDVSRPKAMTVHWIQYAQSLTDKPVKGMLTGPVTLLQWSFVRDDKPRAEVALQIALAIRDEVKDLEGAGSVIIQIDEPALREGVPLRRSQWESYFAWATRAFRVAASGVDDATQIHTHMCYAEFNDILPQIAALDADVITLEASRSDLELLRAFRAFSYPNEVGPGVYDIHSPRVPTVEEMEQRLRKACAVIAPAKLWVNPDCGLKTRNWIETEAALSNMVAAARRLRVSYAHMSI